MTEEREVYQTTNSREAQIQAAYDSGDTKALLNIIQELQGENVLWMAANARLKAQVDRHAEFMAQLAPLVIIIENAARAARLFGEGWNCEQ
jgi:hypothetical protein